MSISAIIIARNEEERIAECLKSLRFTDEIIVVDNGSIDKTVEIAKKLGAKLARQLSGGFSAKRNKGAKEAKGEWIFYVDADERVTPKLKKEIKLIVNSRKSQVESFVAYAIPRRNYILGREMKHGGWWPDYVIRLIKKDSLIGWKGELHEQPKFRGNLGYIKNPLIHLKHDNFSDMVTKTNEWSEIEAKLMYREKHPPMNILRFFSAMFREFWLRMVVHSSFLDGSEGIIYALYQVYSRFISYAKLWEMQLKVIRNK